MVEEGVMAFMLFPPLSFERTQESVLTVVPLSPCRITVSEIHTEKVLAFLSLHAGDSAYYREFRGRVGCWEEHFARSCTLPTAGTPMPLNLPTFTKLVGLSHC